MKSEFLSSSKQYDLVFSLGASCACALYMKKAALRTYASPFDWLIHADFRTRMELLLNDFQDFMNLEDFQPAPVNPAKHADSHTADYENTRTGFYYYHDFPADCPLQEAFPAVREKYLRRIERFYELLKTGKKVLLIWFAHEWKTEDEQILQLWEQFCGKIGRTPDLLVIENCPEMPYGEVTGYALSEHIMRYQLHTDTVGANGLMTTLGDEEHCLKIFQQYQLIPSRGYRFRRGAVRIFAGLACLVLPVKRWRKRIRQYARYY